MQKLALRMAKKKLWDVMDTRSKREFVLAELKYRHLGLCPILVSSVKKRLKKIISQNGQDLKIVFC